MAVIGYLSPRSKQGDAPYAEAFHRGANESGFVEGQNLTVDYRRADDQFERLPALAADLVRLRVEAIVAVGLPAALAAKAATTSIPIVFTAGADPVKFGLVASLSRPGGNVTGVNTFGGELGTKALGLLRELVPNARTIALLVNPKNALAELTTKDVEAAARTIGQPIQILQATTLDDIDRAFADLGKDVGALLIGNDVFFNGHVDRLATLAMRHSLPTLYIRREFAVAGGLVSYGPSLTGSYYDVGLYVGRILKGAKPAELPVLQPTKFELVINLKTAKAIGLDIPPMLLARADEVIE